MLGFLAFHEWTDTMSRTGNWVLFLSGLAAGAILGWFICFPPTDSSSAAGWAQAIGTIAAIVGSVIVTRMQMRHVVAREEIARRRERDERLGGVVAMSNKLVIACGRTQRTVKAQMAAKTDYREAIRGFHALAEGGIAALGTIPLHEPPYVSIAREVIVLQRAIFLHDRRITKLIDSKLVPDLDLEKAQAILNRMSREMRRLRVRAERAMAAHTVSSLDLSDEAE